MVHTPRPHSEFRKESGATVRRASWKLLHDFLNAVLAPQFVLFTSTRFLLFFAVVVPAFFLTPKTFRWALLLTASYYFYMNWRASYLVLIVASTLISYFCGMGIDRSRRPARRKSLLWMAMIGNLGMLFYFKYSTFAVEAVGTMLQTLGSDIPLNLTAPLLPVGISFFVFQSLSYVLDVYQRARSHEKHPGVFAAYIAYFPQLVAGPIERSTRLLPQFHEHQMFDWQRAKSGLALMLWGWFKKLVVADNLASIVDIVYSHPVGSEGHLLSMATVLFAFQIYCDFSAYSDIAIGTARIMGFSLMENFNRPYLATSIPDFWRRWHISLSTWFRDYLYIPLGGSRVRLPRWTLNILVVFLLSGLWHGANWTFVAWGLLHGVYMLISRFTRVARSNLVSALGIARHPMLHRLLSGMATFLLVLL